MGRVFTEDEVENGYIPKLKDFPTFLLTARHDLEQCAPVVAAQFCGSVALEKYSIRSDVDMVVVYRTEGDEKVVAMLQTLAAMAAKLYIPFKPIRVPLDIAVIPAHHIGMGLYEHLGLVASEQSIIKADPRNFLNMKGSDVANDTLQYLRFKLGGLQDGEVAMLGMPDILLHKFLSKAIAAPTHVARKMIRCLGKEMLSDSASEVRNVYPDLVDDDLGSMFTELTRVDQQYSRILEEQLTRPDLTKHAAAVSEIVMSVPLAIRFVKANAKLLFASN